MSPKDKYLIVIAGPTAVGKTALSIRLAQRFNTVIVSADSRQMFKEMDIGTAKPTTEELAAVPHYFVNHLTLEQPYSAGRYARDCHTLLNELFQKHDVIFLTGGSGLYIRAVIEGFDSMPTVPTEIRKKWEDVYAAQGIEVLQQKIQQADPVFAETVDMQNHMRLIRAVSLIEVAGKPVSDLRKEARAELPFRVMRIFCNLPRKELYERIHARVDAMVAAGLTEEVRTLLPYRDTQAMQTVGYRELVAYFDRKGTLEEAIAKIKQHSCNYAKRQITWFRNQGEWREFNPPDESEILRLIQEITGT